MGLNSLFWKLKSTFKMIPQPTKRLKYWHEIPQEEIKSLINSGVTNQHVVDNYKQPDWCGYPEALMGMMGCWSLTDNTADGLRTKICKDFCFTCPYFKQKSPSEDRD